MDTTQIIILANGVLWSISSFLIMRSIGKLDELTKVIDSIIVRLAVFDERVGKLVGIDDEIKKSKDRFHELANMVTAHELKIVLLGDNCKECRKEN